jgi:NAD(P)-dependent dehydrogenase (short-subunit alcohol dehydrogenase family)
VVLADLSKVRARFTADTIRGEGGEAFPLVVDVTSAVACADLVAQVEEQIGPPNHLVNSAAVVDPEMGVLGRADVWERVLDVNLLGPLHMTQAVLPGMMKRGEGSIVNVSSISGLAAMGSGAYGVSKAALNALTAETAFVAGHVGVRANTVVPGYIWAPMSAAGGLTMQAVHRNLTLLDRSGTAWDVAGAVAFLSSDAARWVTGVALPVDGGTMAATVNEGWPVAAELGNALLEGRID